MANAYTMTWLSNAQSANPPAAPGATPPDTSAREGILLVGLRDTTARSLSVPLSDAGHLVRVVPDLASLASILAAGMPPIAVIVDIEATADANSAVANLQFLRCTGLLPCPVLVLSHRDDIHARLTTARAGFDAHLLHAEALSRVVECLDWLRCRQGPAPYRVVIIDDDRFTAQVMAISLQRAGLEATIIHQLEDVLSRLRAARPDVVLVDIHMPDCNGIDLAAAIRQVPEFLHIPLIFVTGEQRLEQRMQALRSGGNDFLIKPVDPVFLVGAVTVRAQWSRLLRATLDRLEAARQRADGANKAKTNHVTQMVHELRTPLNAVLGYAQLLHQTEPLTPRQRSALSHVLSAGEHLLNLTGDALDLARIEAGKVALSLDELNPGVLCHDCITLSQPEAERRNVRLVVRFADDALPLMLADSLRFKQVLLNLLSNAIKYGGTGAEVSLDIAPVVGHRLRFSVADTGPGIAPHHLDGLFQPFHRLPQKGAKVEGTGMGLSIARRLVEAMGGTIGVTSTQDIGTTFWFELPLAQTTP